MFLEKLKAQGWLKLFANTQRGCFVLDLVEFYANCEVNQGVVTSMASGKPLWFNAKELAEILGIPSECFRVYAGEDKTVLRIERLLQLTQRLSQQPDLKAPWSVKKGETALFHRLLFLFIIKNIIPWGQGRNLMDAMDQCFTDLLDWGEQINLPTIMISHISTIANTARDHDLGYGLLFSSIFQHFGVSLQKKVGLQVKDEIGSNTLLGCGFKVTKGGTAGSEQGLKTPFSLVPSSSTSEPYLDNLLQDQSWLKDELSEVSQALSKEKALNANRHEDLLNAISALTTKLSSHPS